jgi:peptidoglycan-associated lipoprotein
MRNFRSVLIIMVASVALAACGGRKSVEEDINVEAVDGTAGASSSGLLGDDSSSTSGLDGSSNANADLLNSRVIYFEYNSSALTLESETVVQAHAQYLNNAPGVGIILEGHADERGTREYNLALAEDRAKEVANVMQALGVSGGRIQTISYGEERPVSLGGDESAWGLNRRVEILYQ